MPVSASIARDQIDQRRIAHLHRRQIDGDGEVRASAWRRPARGAARTRRARPISPAMLGDRHELARRDRAAHRMASSAAAPRRRRCGCRRRRRSAGSARRAPCRRCARLSSRSMKRRSLNSTSIAGSKTYDARRGACAWRRAARDRRGGSARRGCGHRAAHGQAWARPTVTPTCTACSLIQNGRASSAATACERALRRHRRRARSSPPRTRRRRSGRQTAPCGSTSRSRLAQAIRN